VRRDGNLIRFDIGGNTLEQLVIETSTNLTDWFALYTNQTTSGMIEYNTLFNAKDSARYFRGR
jgi:hypothetical protein